MGIADREAAENCRGVTVQIRRAHFPPLEDNEFYWVDLIGHAVVNLRGELLGNVIGLIDNGAHPILRVADAVAADAKKPEEILIPFVDHFVPSVDQAEKKITVDWERDY
jgi:16S rRNA processing protein RimM